MTTKTASVLLACMALAACASPQPRVVQTSSNATEIRLAPGLATQIELPEGDRVQSVMVGKPSMVSTDQSGNVVSLLAKDGEGETNIIVRAVDEDGHNQTFQYRLTVQAK